MTRLDRLIEDRDHLESAIKCAEPHQLAALVREHRAILKEIDALAEPKKGSIRDQLAAKRAEREAGTSGSPAAEV